MKQSFASTCTAVAALSGVVLAHHIPKPLSYGHGKQALTEITFYNQPQNKGVPTYAVGTDEVPEMFSLRPDSTFTVSDHLGHVQQIVFQARDFQNIQRVTLKDALKVINKQLTIGMAFEANEQLGFQNFSGGLDSILTLEDGHGTPLALMNVMTSPYHGEFDIPLVLSHFEEGQTPPDYSGYPYVMFASTTDGETNVGGVTLPIAFDQTTTDVVRLTRVGVLNSFQGHLNQTEDAHAKFKTELLPTLFPSGTPSKLYFAYVIYSPDGTIPLFASNKFTVNIVN